MKQAEDKIQDEIKWERRRDTQDIKHELGKDVDGEARIWKRKRILRDTD